MAVHASGEDDCVPDFLVASIVLSVVLTIVVNLVLWLFPSVGRRLGDSVQRLAERPSASDPQTYDMQVDRPQRSRVQVFFPWKAMLIGSVVLTVVLNLAIVLFD